MPKDDFERRLQPKHALVPLFVVAALASTLAAVERIKFNSNKTTGPALQSEVIGNMREVTQSPFFGLGRIVHDYLLTEQCPIDEQARRPYAPASTSSMPLLNQIIEPSYDCFEDWASVGSNTFNKAYSGEVIYVPAKDFQANVPGYIYNNLSDLQISYNVSASKLSAGQ